MSSPTVEQLLDGARAGDLDRLGEDREAVADAVRTLAERGDGASALELVAGAWRIWFSRGEVEEGRAALATALEAPGAGDASTARTRALYADGVFAFRQGDQEGSRTRNEEALAVAQAVSDPRGECDALTGLARVSLRDGDYDRVVELAEQARERARAAGDAARGETDQARALIEQGKEALAATGLALDPDDQFEVDWLTGQLSA